MNDNVGWGQSGCKRIFKGAVPTRVGPGRGKLGNSSAGPHLPPDQGTVQPFAVNAWLWEGDSGLVSV